MAEHPYMPFFPEKFFGDTAHVPGDVAGYYVVLLAHAWTRGGSLPDDDDQLRLMTRCHPKRWCRIREVLRSFWFVGDDGRLHQKRMDKEWQRAAAWRQNQRKTPAQERQQGIFKSRVGNSGKGIKPNKINATPPESTRARALTHTHTQNSLPYGRENSEGAPASLRVLKAHASPDAPSPNGETEPSPPLDDAARARLVAGFDRLVAEIAGAKLVTFDDCPTVDVSVGTKADVERKAAEEKLAQWVEKPPPLTISPLLSTMLGLNKPLKRARRKANGHARH